ncbi:MAG: tRNA 2-thiouridine(34) synthase MnmA [Candidatus Omnitrophota bacterium]|jgi:tRNA-specific 2-thiouridylase|nr:MAG: tRNA 2-thiouridine(34) synthase MnmA [Candidatus Omnitrophota bacterium]
MKKRVVVAMSGGVDSSVAAALLVTQGYDVIGITMCFNIADPPRKKPACCGLQGIEDARRVAHTLGIRHYVLNFKAALQDNVIDDFCNEYFRGRTPNPCIRCNQYLKFGALLRKAISLDAAFLATGHYARIEKNQAGPSKGYTYLLKKAKDLRKDQSYFLYRLSQRQLSKLLFPLGGYTKEEVRSLARDYGLAVAGKLASQEICFLPEDDYRVFLRNRAGDKIKPGPIVDTAGNMLGIHKGIALYTIGQRQGLGVAAGYPLYITALQPDTNTVVVGRKEEAFQKACVLKDVHCIGKPLKNKIVVRVRIRYNHKEDLACVTIENKKARAIFKKPQFAITPGQSAVFYDRDTIIGGGIIQEATTS